MKSVFLIIFGIACLIAAHFSKNGQKIGKYKYYDGEIVDINCDAKKLL